MNNSNGNQRAQSLEQDYRPLHRPYLRLTDDDALTPRIQSVMQGSDDLPLGRALSFVLGLY